MSQPNFTPAFTTRPELSGSFGMVASTHWLASAVGMGVLERGGNAFDAAVATGLTLQVVEPHLNGPAGEVPIIFHAANTNTQHVISGQGPAPGGVSIEHFEALGLDLIPGTGLLAACVPSAFDSWMLLLRDHGTLTVREVLAPAIHYARHGYPVLDRIQAAIAALTREFTEHWPSSGAIYLPQGRPPATGSLLTNPALADTYERLVQEAESHQGSRENQLDAARGCWHDGFIAHAIDDYCRKTEIIDSTGQAQKALLTGDDLHHYRAHKEAPLAYDYHGYRVLKADAWTQGPAMLQQLALLKGFDLSAMDPYGADFIHTVTECAKLAFADRDAWYTDPATDPVPITALISDAYADQRRALIDPNQASDQWQPGNPDGHAPTPPSWITDPPAPYPTATIFAGGEPTRDRSTDRALGTDTKFQPERGDTCHLDIIDRWGNMVAATPSGGWLQSSPIIPDLGFPLGTRLQMFWLERGLPGSLAPGKRPRTTLSPSLALRDGDAYMAFGTPGGDQQEQWPLLVFLRHIHHGLNLQQAIDAPAFHTDHLAASFWPRPFNPASLALEDRFHPDVITALQQRGHGITMTGDWSLGRVSACSQTIDDKGRRVLKAGANPRGMQGYATGR
ncbi:MAG: gamma-glutamyltransferase family protein [Pseudomonadota bacterium]